MRAPHQFDPEFLRNHSARPEDFFLTRRQFLNRAYFAAVLVALGNFALASLDYLWPRGGGGLGSKITVGDAKAEQGFLRELNNQLQTVLDMPRP